MNESTPTQPKPQPIAVTRKPTKTQQEAAAWLHSLNPLRGLTIAQAQQIFDQARRGVDVRLQWVYHNIEQADPTLMICAERRSGALLDLDWTIRPRAAGRIRGFDETLAEEQTAFLEAAFADAEESNLFPAIEHLATAFFRGHAHIQPLYTEDGQSLKGFELFDAWNFCRSVYTPGIWYWNPRAEETADPTRLQAIPPREICTLVRPRHIDYPAMAIFLRNALGERAWGQFLERYGVPPVIITMPPDMDPAQVDNYRAAAEKVADGGVGALPYGSTVTYATEARGTNPFREFLEHQQQLVVLMATGGMLTSLTGATGIGQGASDAHEETWRMIVRRDATAIATALNRTVSDALLDRAFPGQPHLAQFDFETEPAPSPEEVFDLAAKAVTAGYRVTLDELRKRTGYELEELPQAPAQQAFGDPTGAPFLNRAEPHRETVLNSEAADRVKALAHALALDFTPAAEAVQTFLQAPSPEAAALLQKQLPDLLPDDPEAAKEMEQILAEAYGEALQRKSVMNFNPNHDKNGLFAKEDGGEGASGGGGSGAEKTAPTQKDLPELPADKMTKAEYRKTNRARGEVACEIVMAGEDVPEAMRSRKLGTIDFLRGNDAWGFQHAIAKHGEDAVKKIPETLAYGSYYHDERELGCYVVVYGNHLVSLKPIGQKHFEVITAYEAKEKAAHYKEQGGKIENKAEDDIGATY